MINGIIACFTDLNSVKKQEFLDIFLESFGHMFTFAQTKAEQKQLFSASLESPLSYAYISENHICGILGLGTNFKRALKFDKQLCIQLFGKVKGITVHNLLHKIAEIPAVKKDTDLYIDYLATNPQMRNKGIAAKLLTFACELPQYKDCYLEVLSKNVSAMRLYQNFGFTMHKKRFDIFTFMQGLGYPVILKKALP